MITGGATGGIFILLSAILGIVLALSFGLRYIIKIDERTEEIAKNVMSRIKVTKIEEGTVIDHIPIEKFLDVYEALDLEDSSKEITMATNLKSDKLGKKAIVKIERRTLSKEEMEKVKDVTDKATVNIVKDWEVEEKHRLSEL